MPTLFNTHARTGNTPLHEKILTCKTFREIEAFIGKSETKTIEKMARTVNNKGLLPIQLVETSLLGDLDKFNLRRLLLKVTTDHEYKPITQKISETKFEKTLKKYQVKANTTLHQNLLIAKDLVNEVRANLECSITHPSINSLSLEEKIILDHQITELRANIRQEYATNPQSRLFEINAKQTLATKIGKCKEYSYVTMYFAKAKYPQIQIERWCIEWGDHIFTVLGEGNDRVVCDAWSGKVYPFSALNNELKALGKMSTPNNVANITIFYNSKYFKAVPAEDNKAPEKKSTCRLQ